jgi:hypothetical protein
LFAGYYLRPQELIMQGRLGSSYGAVALLGYCMAERAQPALLGYDGFYFHRGGFLYPNWEVIRKVAKILPLTVAAPTILMTVARMHGVTVAEIPCHAWMMKKAVAVLVEIGFEARTAEAAIPYLTRGAELAAAWLICAGALMEI